METETPKLKEKAISDTISSYYYQQYIQFDNYEFLLTPIFASTSLGMKFGIYGAVVGAAISCIDESLKYANFTSQNILHQLRSVSV